MHDSESTPHLEVLDGLRGFAIVLVVLAHSFMTHYRPAFSVGPVSIGFEPLVLGGGALGVELFFFLSGFVLFLPYARAALGLRERPTLGRFIDRRFIKIVPSYLIAVLLVAYLFTQDAAVVQNRFFHILTHVLFINPWWHSTIFSIDGAFWSIGVEVQFYVIFPLLALAMSQRPLATYLAMLAVGEGFRLWLQATGRNQDFFWVCQLPAQIDLFGLGMFSAYLFVKYGKHLPNRSAIATSVALVALAVWIVLVNQFAKISETGKFGVHDAWQNDHRLIVGWLIALIALGSLFGARWWRLVLANPVLVWLSVISYNLYLWHESIITQCIKTIFPCGIVPTPWLTNPHWGRDFFWWYVLLSIAAASFFTYLIERPLLQVGTRGTWDRVVRVLARRSAR